MTAAPYTPRLFIDGHVPSPVSTFRETGWSTDTASLPAHNPGGWAQAGFSTDTPATDAGRSAIQIIQREW